MKPTLNKKRYIPALRFHCLTRFYDVLIRNFLKEEKIKNLLMRQAQIKLGQRVLDLGCGTGTLTILLKKNYPDATVIGLDSDPKILEIARNKATLAGVNIEFREGMAFEPQFASGYFDRVVSSLVFHHLSTNDKKKTLRAIRELLKPQGELHIVDWGKARNIIMRIAFLPVQIFDGFETTTDNVQGHLPEFMEEAGFISVAETCGVMTLLGTLSLYRGLKA